RIHQLFARLRARGRPTLAFGERRGPQSGRILLRPASQGVSLGGERRHAAGNVAPILAGMPSVSFFRVPSVPLRLLAIVRACVLAALLALVVPAAHADTIPVKSAELRI